MGSSSFLATRKKISHVIKPYVMPFVKASM